jgi:hypothetical protein
MSKGSSPRPFSVTAEDFSTRWEAIFSKGKSNANNVQETRGPDGSSETPVNQVTGSVSSGDRQLPADNKPSQ